MVPGPTLILFLARHCLLGIFLAAASFAVTFGSVAMGTAIFLLPRR